MLAWEVCDGAWLPPRGTIIAESPRNERASGRGQIGWDEARCQTRNNQYRMPIASPSGEGQNTFESIKGEVRSYDCPNKGLFWFLAVFGGAGDLGRGACGQKSSRQASQSRATSGAPRLRGRESGGCVRGTNFPAGYRLQPLRGRTRSALADDRQSPSATPPSQKSHHFQNRS